MNENNKRPMYTIGKVADILNCGLGRNQLYDFLKKQNIIEWNNAPKSEFISKGYFIYHIAKKPWSPRQFVTTLVTEEGLKFIKELVKK
jgi:phage antirepressor YoqD-like protein